MSFGARAEIRLDALKHNFETLKAPVPGAKVMVAVKANAYGHGLCTVSRALADADAFAVARLVEAQKLRKDGIDKPIVLMGGVGDLDDYALAARQGFALVIHTESQVALFEAAEIPAACVWLKIDTGMNRLGVRPENAPALIARIRSAGPDCKLGLMTHLANADDTTDPMSRIQIERFCALADQFDGDVSVANSAALLGFQREINSPGQWSNTGDIWIRPGISLYGVSPLLGKTAKELNLRSVMQFESELIAVKPIKKGERVGYGGCWLAECDSVIGIVAAGFLPHPA